MKLVCVAIMLALASSIDLSYGVKQTVEVDDDIYHAWENLRGVFSAMGDFFGHKVRNVKDLWSDGKDNLQRKVDDTVTFLQAVKDNQAEIMKNAKAQGNKKLQDAVHNAGTYLKDAKAFQESMRKQAAHKAEDLKNQASEKAHETAADAKARYHELANDWQTKTTGWWNGGLESLSDWAHFLQSKPQRMPFYKRFYAWMIGSVTATIGVSVAVLGLAYLIYTQRGTICSWCNKQGLAREGNYREKQTDQRPVAGEAKMREGQDVRQRERRNE